MDSTSGGDANDEFARWLAEQAQQQAAAQPGSAPPAGVPVPPSAPPAAPPVAESYGPPTMPYEPGFDGPQVARSSFQPPAPPGAAPAFPPAEPSWAPAYTAPQGAPAVPAAVDPVGTPFFPAPQAPPPAVPPVPPAAPAPPAFEPAPVAPPAFEPAAYAPPTVEPAAFPPPAFEPAAYPPPTIEPVATPAPSPEPAVQPPAFEPQPPAMPVVEPQPPVTPAVEPAPPVFTPEPEAPPAPAPVFDPSAFAAPAAPYPVVDPSPAPAPTTPYDGGLPPLVPDPGIAQGQADPLGALFATGDEAPAADDPMRELFGLQTEGQPVVADPPEAAPPVYAPEPAQPFSVPEPAQPFFEPAPEAGAPVPEPAAAYPAPAPASPAGVPPTSTALSPAPPDDDPTAGTQFFGGGTGDWEEPPALDRSTIGERLALVLAIVLPPVGLIWSIVSAVRSSRLRGWVHRLVRVALVVSVITTIAAVIGGIALYGQLEETRKHDAIAASSAQYCATIAEHPDMIKPPTFGFPEPGASIPDTISTIQEYVDRWDALAVVSPSGIRADVTRVADAAREILDAVTTSRLVDHEQNVSVMNSVAGSTNVVGWAEEYCG